MPKADPRSARKRQRSKGRPSARPTSKEYQQALDEIDTLRPELIRKDQTIAQLQAELRTKDQTIDHLELKDRAKEKRMGDLHDQIYQLGSANRDRQAAFRWLSEQAQLRDCREARTAGLARGWRSLCQLRWYLSAPW